MAKDYQKNKKIKKYILYSHDGRGAGHISRTVALAQGIKRFNPDSAVLIITGSDLAPKLANNPDIEFVKVPTYKKTKKSLTPLLCDKYALSKIRKKMIQGVIKAYNPDIAIIEYFPEGKLGELQTSLRYMKKIRCKIYYGFRGVIGEINNLAYKDIFNKRNCSIMKKYYSGVFCYTSQNVFDPLVEYPIEKPFLKNLIFTGYVSRAYELKKIAPTSGKKFKYDLLIGLGCSVKAFALIKILLNLKGKFFPNEKWCIFLGEALSKNSKIKIFNKYLKRKDLDIIEYSSDYLDFIQSASRIISHGGYNSITDTLYYNKPTVYIARDVPEKDQEIHLKFLKDSGIIKDFLCEHSLNEKRLYEAIINIKKPNSKSLSLLGSKNVGSYFCN